MFNSGIVSTTLFREEEVTAVSALEEIFSEIFSHTSSVVPAGFLRLYVICQHVSPNLHSCVTVADRSLDKCQYFQIHVYLEQKEEKSIKQTMHAYNWRVSISNSVSFCDNDSQSVTLPLMVLKLLWLIKLYQHLLTDRSAVS